MMSPIVMTVVGEIPGHWQPRQNGAFPAPQGFCWRFVPEANGSVQVRSVLRLQAEAVVVWVNPGGIRPGDTIERAAKLIERLLATGVQVVIAVNEIHQPDAEFKLRQAGALYMCAGEAAAGLGERLHSILRSRSSSHDERDAVPQRLRMDAG